MEPNCCHLVVGSDGLTYENETAAPAANSLDSKIMFNSTINTCNVKFRTICIKDFFLSSTMGQPEYMKLHIDKIPDNIIDKYNLQSLHDFAQHVHFIIKKGMYVLAAILAYNQLKSSWAPHEYNPIPNTDSLWKYESNPVQFCL